jgi:putative ABC transport system substrate-binding protein
MRRREFIAMLGGAAAWPLSGRTQQAGRTYRIGFLIPAPRDIPASAAMFDELRLNGFIEGENLLVLPNGFEVPTDVISERAAALVEAAPDVIVAGPDLQLRALQARTQTIPLVGMTEDMVAAGLVASLARPGRNTTGISLLSPELDGKRQDILMEAVPGMQRMAALADGNVTPPPHLQELQQAAQKRGIALSVLGVTRPEELVAAINSAKERGAEALNFLASPLFSIPDSHSNRLILQQLTELRLPAIFQWPETAETGALMGYGPRFVDVWRQRARMVVKVLRGGNPADMPVEQPTTFSLVINLRTAKAIDHEIPAGLVLRADQVIE